MFNTLRYAKRLQEAGFSREQAEAHIQIVTEIIEDEMATKADMNDLKKDLHNDMEKLEYRLIIKLGTIVTLGIAAMATIVKFF